jgi:predicted dehydrogenase
MQPAGSGTGRIRLGIAGFGARGQRLARAAAGVPGLEIAAVADAYAGRLERAREILGDGVALVRDARRLIERRDLDAVAIATPDHLHAPLAEAALAAGRHVYCEIPVVHDRAGLERLRRAATGATVMQAGSCAASTPLLQLARELLAEGRLGRVLQVRAVWDSTGSIAAWQTPIPPDASPETIEYAAFAGAGAEFDARRFFRWRCHRAFGSGLVGGRVVPLVAAVHWLTGASRPAAVAAMGALRRWRDGRETPDTLAAWLDYPEGFGVELAVSLNGVRPRRELAIVGTLGALTIGEHDVTFHAEPLAEPYEAVAETWPARYREWFYMIHGMTPQGLVRGSVAAERAAERYEPPAAVAPETAHLADFVESIRAGRAPREPLAAGLAAADAGLLVAEAAEAGAVVR